MFYNRSMNIVNYLVDTYGYDTPIFLKNVRIGGKSKAAVKEAFYRASKSGQIEKKKNGVYFVRSNKEFGSGITFDNILKKKFMYKANIPEGFEKLFIVGYYSGLTFLNMIGISNQVPFILEVTTNNTSSKKRYFSCGNSIAVIRKARTEITSQNCEILQFLDMFHFVTLDDVKKNKKMLRNYIQKMQFSKALFYEYIKFYNDDTLKKLVEGGIIDAFV